MFYDFVVIYRADEKIEEMRKLVEEKTKDYNIEITEIEVWGTKLLAYPIKKENSGHFVSYRLNANKEDIDSLESEIVKLQNDDKILKFIIVKL